MNLILFDPADIFTRLFPLTLSRPVAAIRVGILTIAEKWEKISGEKVSYQTAGYLMRKYPVEFRQDNIYINGSVIPDFRLLDRIMSLNINQALVKDNIILAIRTSDPNPDEKSYIKMQYDLDPVRIQRLSDIFLRNGEQIENDFALLGNLKRNNIPDVHTIVYSGENVYLGERVSLKAGILDADSGPIFIGNDVTILPGAVISGPCAILDHSVVSQGAKIRPNTTLGPFSKVGGEVSNVVFQGYSNKTHDGFLGTSVIGEWCNFGAGTNNSNLKNNYSDIKVWDFSEERMVSTGLQYYGLVMGDHTRCGINTMFNTGTIAGFSANIYDGGYMPKFIPSFAWGNRNGFSTYDLDKALYTAKMVMERRSVVMTDEDSAIFKYIFNFTRRHRTA